MSTPATQTILLTSTQLGQLLRGARKRRGLTQAEVGARLGLSQNRVSHLEGHADELSAKQLLTWCAVVGLELTMAERQTQTAQPGETSVQTGTSPEW
jgi:HTH-type transcriptional regulator/antitoxin HipB